MGASLSSSLLSRSQYSEAHAALREPQSESATEHARASTSTALLAVYNSDLSDVMYQIQYDSTVFTITRFRRSILSILHRTAETKQTGGHHKEAPNCSSAACAPRLYPHHVPFADSDDSAIKSSPNRRWKQPFNPIFSTKST